MGEIMLIGFMGNIRGDMRVKFPGRGCSEHSVFVGVIVRSN